MRKVMGVVLLALAGAGTAALITASTAAAWDYTNLPPNCHTEGAPFDAAVMEYVAYFRCDGVAAHFNYGTQAPPAAATDPSFQGNLDAFVNAHYTASATTASAPATTTDAAATITPPGTTPAPAVTQTVVQTVTQSAPADTTTTTAAPLTPTEQSLQDQIDALAAKIVQLTDRTTRLEKASDAAWLAFRQAVAGGASIADAAEIARGTALNVIYGLGDFAPAP